MFSLKIIKGMQMKTIMKYHCTHTVDNGTPHGPLVGTGSTSTLKDSFAVPNPLKMSTPRTQQLFS